MSLRLHVFNLVSALFPSRGGMLVRRVLLSLAGVKIEGQVRIAHRVSVYDRYLEIGEGTWIGAGTFIATNSRGPVVIGRRVDIAPGCWIASGTHALGPPSRRAGQGEAQPISIGEGTWVGMHSTILAGARIGRGTVVAAGSVVPAGTYPENVLLAGVPARVKRELPTDGLTA